MDFQEIGRAYTSSFSNSGNRSDAKLALTSALDQWQPASDQYRARGATDLGLVRSVFDLADFSLFDR